MTDEHKAPHVQAAFINAIREEGTLKEACHYLQKVWNERCQLATALEAAHAARLAAEAEFGMARTDADQLRMALRAAEARERQATALLREEVRAAYIQGAMDVHENWEPSRAPDFSEAADDYAAAVLRAPEDRT